jgi:hypothetical protein
MGLKQQKRMYQRCAMDFKRNTLRLAIKNLGVPLTLKSALNKIIYYNHYYFMSLYIRRSNKSLRIREDIELSKPKQKDLDRIIQNLSSYSKNERKEIIRIYNFLKNGFFDTCFFVKNRNDEVVAIQCLIEPIHNEIINKKMANIWPILKKEEVMLEELYIFPGFRSLGIFPTVNHLMLKVAEKKGYSVCRSFIRKDNVLSLNGFLNLGFKIEKLYTQINLLGMSWRGASAWDNLKTWFSH